jgi:hypothetical protein
MSYNIVRYYVFSKFVYYGGPPTAINSLAAMAMGSHERPTFNELRARVVSPRIFVRC